MADKKISALSGATTPLAGTEVLPVVQNGSTVKVSVENITAGRNISTVAVNCAQVNITAAPTLLRMTNPDAHDYLIYSAATASNGFDGYGIYDLTLGAYVLKIGATGDVEATSGNLVIGTAGKGIDFSANTPATGMTSELLDWYEEGNYTPTVTAGSGSITSFTATAWYTRIGREVTVIANVAITDAGTGTGVCTISLPFTNNATVIASGTGRENAITGSQLQGSVALSANTMDVRQFNNATIVATGAQIRINVTYFV